MATPTPIQSVTVALRTGVSDATLPNNIKMRSGISYAISLDDYSKLSRGARETVIAEPTYNTAPWIVPYWNAAGYVLDLDTINNYASIALLNQDAQAAKDFVLGDVVVGFNNNAFKLVKVDSSSTAIAAGDVVVWGGVAHSVAEGKAASVVTGDFSDVTDQAGEVLTFAGVSIGTITANQYGWIQVAGVATAKVASTVDAGEPVWVSTTDETLDAGATNATQVITLTNWDGVESFKLTFMGNETAAIVRGTNGADTDVQAALEGIANIAPGDILVAGAVGAGPFTVTFLEGGAWEGLAVPAITVTSPSGNNSGTVATTVVGGETGGTTVGTAQTAADTGTALVEIRSALAKNIKSRSSKLFLDPRN